MTTKKKITPLQAFLPIVFLVGLLSFNVFVFKDDALGGSNQFVLLLGAAFASIIGFRNGVGYDDMMKEVAINFKSTTPAIMILLMVGALSGIWLVSGIIPAMIYYGLQILHPSIFLPASIVICALISIATGSSWTTSATVGIALIGIGKALGVPMGMTAGAVLSGAYFGDKLSPLSDTTNLAPAMAGTDLFTHIRYMTYTTIPSITITLVIFIVLGLTLDLSGSTDIQSILDTIDGAFNINGWLFIVPVLVILMIIKKAKPMVALLIGSLLGGLFALIFQGDVLSRIVSIDSLTVESAYRAVMQALTSDVAIDTGNEELNDLFSSGGMKGMMGTIWLIMCAMAFGGVMESIGALEKISKILMQISDSIFGLYASTVASCLAINVTASDQYLALVIPGKMFSKAYKEKGLAPENLSRTLEDAGTVTSVLVPWNTCGAYQSQVLGVGVGEYFVYAIFNYISPFMTLLFAAFRIKIKMLTEGEQAKS